MTFEVIAEGAYLEGLCIDGDTIWVSDAVAGGVRRINPDGSTREYLPGRQWIGSLLANGDGTILISGDGGIMWLDGETGETGMLIDSVDGKPLGAANEMAPDRRGGIVFGGLDLPPIIRGEKSAPVPLYRLDAQLHATMLVPSVVFANGLAVSEDGLKLYHNDTFSGTSVYNIAPDGSVDAGTFLLDKDDVDGLAMDVTGTLWIAGYKSDFILCLNPDGSEQRRIPLQPGGCTSIRFGGRDRRDVYVTNVPLDAGDGLAVGAMPAPDGSRLYRFRSDVAGVALPPPMLRFRWRSEVR